MSAASDCYSREPVIEVDPEHAASHGSRCSDDGSESTTSRSSVASYLRSSLRLLTSAPSAPRTFVQESFENELTNTARVFRTNNEQKLDLDDMTHHCFKLILGGGRLHLAPIGSNPSRILDLGTGKGLWCTGMGEKYPSARIVGTDLSKVQPVRTLSNVSFQIEDFDDEWTASDEKYDLVHHRFNVLAVSNWPQQFEKAFDALIPGGFIEVVDVVGPPQSDDGSIPQGSQLVRLFEHTSNGCRQVGKDLSVVHHGQKQLEEAGYVNIQERILKMPIGGWPRERRLKEAGLLKLETCRVCTV